MIIITRKLLNSTRIKSGGYTEKQARLAKKITQSKAPIKSLEGLAVTEEWWAQFVLAKEKPTLESLTAELIEETFSREDCDFCPTCGKAKDSERLAGKITMQGIV